MVKVPVRADPVLASTVNVNVPVPFPEVVGTWIHEALLTAVQVQPFGAVTVAENEPPFGYPSITDPIDSVYVHDGGVGIGSCTTEICDCPLTLWYAAVISASPVPTPVTRPELFTLATVVLDELH